MTSTNITSDNKSKLASDLSQKLTEIEEKRVEEESKKSATTAGLPYLNLQTFPIDTSALFLVDETVARDAKAAVVSREGPNVTVAVVNPDTPKTQALFDDLRKLGFHVQPVITSMISLDKALSRYRFKNKEKKEDTGIISVAAAEHSADPRQLIAEITQKIQNMSVSQVVELLVSGALSAQASDIHFEPEEKNVRLRYRIDGLLTDITNIDHKNYHDLLARIKLHSGLKLNIHSAPQDGRFTVRLRDEDIEVRVSILPGNFGENIVMRILDPSSIRKKLEDLGMRPDMLAVIRNLLQKTTGAILTSGPTGSGKTTTLYAFVQHLNSPDVKIITIEDPIEYHIQGISQSQVDESAGYTFAGGLRSIVRQDPDVILVGEIRDRETADIGMQAALTGHLVFSTIHTNNAAGTIPRLTNLGVTPATIAPATNCTMAQRLVRRLCESCKAKKKIEPQDYQLWVEQMRGVPKELLPDVNENTEVHYPQKCSQCNMSGYKGRVGVYELLVMNPQIEKIIMTGGTVLDVEEAAVKSGMVKLVQDGLLKVFEGTTSFEEVVRVIGT